MPPKARNLALTNSQAACLIALRHCKRSKSEIAVEAKLDLIKTATALGMLARLGLAQQHPAKGWRATTRGRKCCYQTVPDRLGRNSRVPGPGGQRLLALLDRPMRGKEIVGKLGVTHQRVRQLIIKLHAQGHVRFGDPDDAFWFVMRVGDKTHLLCRDEERVLSAIPREYTTDATKICLASRLPEKQVQEIIERLIASKFVDASKGLRGNRVFRLTTAGLKHPQRSQFASRAQKPRLLVESDRVRKVLSAISDSGAVRIRDVTEMLRIPHRSTNALMQYLKRKRLVKKTDQQFYAPYSLTEKGRAALAEMRRRQAA